MVELKKEAVKDVTSLTKAAPVALAKTKEVLNQAVADLYVAHVALHQVHWYMHGRGFLVWHPKMDEYMEALDGQLDEISERLITLGGSPFSTLTEFLQNSEIEEEAGEYRNVEESLERVLVIYRYLSELFQISEKDGSMTKKIVAIWAQDEEGVIGKENRLPWHLPAELQHFKETTLNHAILMGRVTFDGMGRRLLPKRETLILTRNLEEKIDGVATFQDVQSVLDWYQAQEKNLYIIGGKQIFQAFEPYLDEVIVTHIHARVEGDTYFPEELDLSLFETVSSKFYAKDEKNPYDFTIQYRKRKEV